MNEPLNVNNSFSSLGKYLFVAGTTSSSVTSLFLFSCIALVQCPFDLGNSGLKHGGIAGKWRYFFKAAIDPYKSYMTAAIIPALISSPVLSAQFSRFVLERESSHKFSPEMAAISGWCGSVIALTLASSMAQSKWFQNLRWGARFSIASKIGSTAAAALALFIAQSREQRIVS